MMRFEHVPPGSLVRKHQTTTLHNDLYAVNTRKPTNWWGRPREAPLKFDPKPREAQFCRFANFDKCRSEVPSDVISGVAVYYVGMDVRATFGESGLNSGRITLFFGRPDSFYASLLSSIDLYFEAD